MLFTLSHPVSVQALISLIKSLMGVLPKYPLPALSSKFGSLYTKHASNRAKYYSK
jgi:hypothetical protein